MQMNLLYLHSQSIGYGRLGVHLAEQIKNLGVTVYDHLDGTPPATMETIDGHLKGTATGRSNVVMWVSVPTHARGWWKGQTPVIFTMWEGMKLPEGFRDMLHNFDTVIVPSLHNLELFGKYHDNVRYVPLGIDPARWHPIDRKPPTSEFRYLIGGSGKRKGTDLAVKAFKQLWGKEGSWGDGPVPTLVMKNPKGEFFTSGPGSGPIRMVTGKLTDDEETDLYASAHCYIQPSRGEGFGLQPLQAIAQGCPTILTAAHGHESFAHLGIGLSSKPVKADYFIYGDAGDWWEPDFDELYEAMRDVYERYDFHAKMAQVAAHEAVETFTWENCAKGVIDAIGPERFTAYEGPEEWIENEGLLFRLVTRVDWNCEIAGNVMAFKKGKEYYEIADVKRILMEAGILDPSCLDDGGLAPEQVAKAGKYRAMHENCPFCEKPLQEKTPA